MGVLMSVGVGLEPVQSTFDPSTVVPVSVGLQLPPINHKSSLPSFPYPWAYSATDTWMNRPRLHSHQKVGQGAIHPSARVTLPLGRISCPRFG